MLTLFRTNQQLANIFLLLYLAVLRVRVMLHPVAEMPKFQGVLSEWLFGDLPQQSWVAHLLVFLLVFTQAVLVNLLVARFRIANDISLYPGVFYCLIASFMPDFLCLSSLLLANTFLIISAFCLFDVYKNNYAAARIFDAGLWIGVASLCHFSFSIFAFWGLISLSILRGIRPKEWFMFLIGLFVPYFLFGAYLFWNNHLGDLGRHFYQNLGFFNFMTYKSQTVFLKLGLIGLVVLVLFFVSGSFFRKRNIAAQKYVSILYWAMFLGGLAILFQNGVNLTHFLMIAFPVSVLISMLIQRISLGTAEALHMLLLMGALILQFEYMLI